MQTHEFDNLPVRCGDITVARLSGQVTWRLKDDGSLLTVNALHLRGERDELVEVLPVEGLVDDGSRSAANLREVFTAKGFERHGNSGVHRGIRSTSRT